MVYCCIIAGESSTTTGAAGGHPYFSAELLLLEWWSFSFLIHVSDHKCMLAMAFANYRVLYSRDFHHEMRRQSCRDTGSDSDH